MTKLNEIRAAAEELSARDKAQLIRALATDIGDEFPGIESRADVAGGEACIVRTRIPVWVLEQARRLGSTDDELLNIYPTLRRSDLASAWAYVSAHGETIDRQIRENEAA
jgi:uncharacterized protein (DUF433 family)